MTTLAEVFPETVLIAVSPIRANLMEIRKRLFLSDSTLPTGDPAGMLRVHHVPHLDLVAGAL